MTLAASAETSDFDLHAVLALAVEIILGALLAFAPMAFGSVEPWSEQIVLVLASAALLLALLRAALIPADEQRPNLFASWLPIILFLALIALQLIPFPAGVIHLLSPATLSYRNQFVDASASSFPLSFYPHVTRHDLRIVVSAASVFIAVITVFRTEVQIRRLLIIMTVVGAAVGLLAFVQDIAGVGRVFFVGPLGRGDKATAGPFIAYTHFGQYINLATGVALGLLLVLLKKILRRDDFDPREVIARWREPKLRAIFILACVVVVNMLAMLLSGSRGAVIGAAGAFLVVTLTLSRVRGLPGRGWVSLPLLFIILAAVPFVGFDGVFHKFSTLRQGEGVSSRLDILRDLPAIYRRFPLFGIGLGAHDVVFPGFDRSNQLAHVTHAENDFAQVTEEVGFPGLILVLTFVCIIAGCYVRAVRTCDPSIRLAAVGLGFGLIAVLIQSLMDFAQHIPAVATLSATCCGLIVCLARLSPSALPAKPLPMPLAFAPLRWGGIALLGVVLSLMLWDADRVRAARAEVAVMKRVVQSLDVPNSPIDPHGIADLVAHQTAAIALDPDDIAAHYALANGRWLAIATASNGGALTPDDQQAVRQTIDDLLAARFLCPTFGPLYLLAGQLESTLNDPASLNHFCQAYALSHNSPSACELAARVEAASNNWPAATSALRHLLDLSNDYQTVLDVCVVKSDHAPLALELAQHDRQRLIALANALDAQKQHADLAKNCRTEAEKIWLDACSQAGAASDILAERASYEAAQGNDQSAADYYRRALQQDYSQVPWHLALAQVLARQRQVPDAMHEARICLRLNPQLDAARQLISDLSVTPTAAAQ